MRYHSKTKARIARCGRDRHQPPRLRLLRACLLLASAFARKPAGLGRVCQRRRRKSRRRRAHRGVWVRAQRGIARRSIASQSGSRLSSQSSDLPAWIDLRELRSSRADEVSHLVQIRFGWHACWLRSERHRGGGHRYEVSVLLNWLLRSRFADAQRVRSSIFASLCAAGIEIC